MAISYLWKMDDELILSQNREVMKKWNAEIMAFHSDRARLHILNKIQEITERGVPSYIMSIDGDFTYNGLSFSPQDKELIEHLKEELDLYEQRTYPHLKA